MPTKRRFILFLIVLTLMLLIKRAVGQETAAVGWAPSHHEPGMGEQASVAWVLGLFFGVVSGLGMAVQRASAAKRDQYFTGDLVLLRLQ
jgi:hypothetical protein